MFLKPVLPSPSALWGSPRSDLCSLLCYSLNLGLILRNRMAFLSAWICIWNKLSVSHLHNTHCFHITCLKVDYPCRNRGFRIATLGLPDTSNVTWLFSSPLPPGAGAWALAPVQLDSPQGCCASCWSRFVSSPSIPNSWTDLREKWLQALTHLGCKFRLKYEPLFPSVRAFELLRVPPKVALCVGLNWFCCPRQKHYFVLSAQGCFFPHN